MANLEMIYNTTNALFAGVIGTLLVHLLGWVISRLAGYDWIFPEETYVSLWGKTEENPTVGGLVIHTLIMGLIALVFAVPYILAIEELTDGSIGLYIHNYSVFSIDILVSAIILFLPFGIIYFLFLYWFSKKSDTPQQYPLLVLYTLAIMVVVPLFAVSTGFLFHVLA